MNSSRRAFAIAIATPFLASCATGPQFTGFEPVPPGKSRIYFLREAKIFGLAMTFDILVDGTRIGTLPNGAYLSHVVSPGQHRLNTQTSLIVSTADKRTDVRAPADGRVFVLVALRGVSPNEWTYVFNQITETEALKLLPSLSLSVGSSKPQ